MKEFGLSDKYIVSPDQNLYKLRYFSLNEALKGNATALKLLSDMRHLPGQVKA